MIAPADSNLVDGADYENQNVVVAPIIPSTPPTPLIENNWGSKGPTAAALLANNDNKDNDINEN